MGDKCACCGKMISALYTECEECNPNRKRRWT